MWRRTLAVAAVLAMTFALAPQQPGRAQTEPPEVPDAVQDELPALWSAHKVSITENYGYSNAKEGETEQGKVVTDVVFPTPDRGYALGHYGGTRFVLTTDDGGSSWRPVPARPASADLGYSDLAFPSEDVGYVSTYLFDAPGLVRTTDGGGSWSSVLGNPVGVTDVAFATPELGWVGTSTDDGELLMTTDGGDTWEVMSDRAGGELPEGAGSSAAVLEAVGDTVDDVVLYLSTPAGLDFGAGQAEVYRSDDAGATWTPLGLNSGSEIEFDGVRRIHAVDEEVVFALGPAVGDVPSASVARTTDGGATWQDVTPNLARPVSADAEVPPAGIQLNDIAVARDPQTGALTVGHLVGSVVGTGFVSEPVAFTTTNVGADGVAWEVEPVDQSAFVPRYPDSGSGGAALHSVAMTRDDGAGGSLAAGTNWAIVERTDDPEAWPPDPESACVPPSLAERAPEEAPEGADVPPTVVCEPMGAGGDQEPADEPAFDPQPAGPCTTEGEDGETVEVDEDPDAPFPCVGEVELFNESGDSQEFGSPMYDRALGRVVMVTPLKVDDTRVAMFDPAAMVQRGVEGFGDGFTGDSAWGHHTGVVKLAEGNADLPSRRQGGSKVALMPVDPDARRHSLAMVRCGLSTTSKFCLSASLVTVSLTGQFLPRVAHEFEPIEIGGQPHAVSEVVHLAYDEGHRILYALTEYSTVESSVFGGSYAASTNEPRQVLHAFDADPADAEPGELDKMWSLRIEPQCKRTNHSNFKNMGVSPDGRALVFACQGNDFPYWGFVAFTPHGLMRIGLPSGTDPRDLTQADTNDLDQRFLALPAQIGGGLNGRMAVWTDSSTGLLFWNSPRTVTRVYDFSADRWIGSFQTPDPTSAVTADPETGRLYITTDEGDEGAGSPRVHMGETVNLPVSMRRPVDLAANLPGGQQAFVPDARRVVTQVDEGSFASGVRVFEDRIAPAKHLGVDDPDAATNDIDESEAATVRRDGQARSYGSRVWWSGLRTALPGVDGSLNDGAGGEPFATWSWLFTPEDSPTDSCSAPKQQGLCGGYFTTKVPGMASSTQREAMFGRVSTAELTASSNEHESEAVAASQGTDDDTEGDVRRRRLASEWRRYADDTVLGPWDDDNGDQFDEGRDQMFGHDGWREFERCMDEAIDRLYRELDGERRVSPPIDEDGNRPEDCFGEFDDNDPRGEDRSSVMEQTGVVAASRCHDENTGDDRARKARGSQVDCDAAGERTTASAEMGDFTLGSPEGQDPAGSLSVGSSSSDSTVLRDDDRGIVVASAASASDIELTMTGQGSLWIGQVRSVGVSWAKGRPGTADSWLDVAFEDVRITDADGQTTRFSCGRAQGGDPTSPDEELHHDDEDVEGHHTTCDPHTVVAAINSGFADRVQATTPTRDTDDKIEGSPGGARAIVRRDPSAYWSDFVVNNFSRWEIPALQLTIFNDSMAGPNRMLVDLAGVFTESNYVIGEPLGSYDSGGGTDPGDGNDFDPGPATVTVELTDTDGTPLAGGQFGLTDHTGAPTGTCTTDTSGTCDITGLPAGDYQVSQVSAPTGYLPATDTAPLTLAAGGHATVTFANVWAAGGVTILLTDPSEEPLAGGDFELLVGDGDGNATVFDTCTTGGDGTCAFPDVPLGDVAVRQTATPDGYQPAEPVAFALTSPGQVARLHVINGPAGAGTSGTRGQVVDDPMPQTERISLASSPPAFTGGTQPEVAEPDGLLGRALVLPGQVAQFALRNPGQALLFTLVWLLAGAPLYLAVRRRELNHIKQWS